MVVTSSFAKATEDKEARPSHAGNLYTSPFYRQDTEIIPHYDGEYKEEFGVSRLPRVWDEFAPMLLCAHNKAISPRMDSGAVSPRPFPA